MVRGEREAAIDLDRRDAKAAEVEAFREKKYFGRGEIADKGEVFGHIRSLLRSSLLARGIREFEECYCDLFGGIGAFSEILAAPAICPNRVVIGPLVGDIFLLEMPPAANRRSEEHTSEFQSLMRSSYAVFCLTN